jgi:hypothetical protein
MTDTLWNTLDTLIYLFKKPKARHLRADPSELAV